MKRINNKAIIMQKDSIILNHNLLVKSLNIPLNTITEVNIKKKYLEIKDLKSYLKRKQKYALLNLFVKKKLSLATINEEGIFLLNRLTIELT